jgi:L-aspartate oxidase
LESDRYLIDFDIDTIESEYYDVIIVGSGIAGVYTALEIEDKYSIAMLTKDTINISNSVLAQGGIAVSLGKDDSPQSHFEDTLYAGAGLCNEESVWVLVKNAAENIKRVCDYGVLFDHHKGDLSLTREGAHSQNRIIHAGDSTGKEVLDKLILSIQEKENVTIKERTFAIDILSEDGVCKGILTYDENDDKYKVYLSNVLVCASGGYGKLYRDTTNPEVATGDGAAMAYRAGAELMDMEFIQFHPTVLQHPQNQSFLISEAVRGEGAKLLNSKGERFMSKYHELLELAPRDVVSRAIFQEMSETGERNVYLDITFKGKEYLENRFPMIYKTCLSYGIDMSKDYIPVAPAEHYCMGGIRTDIYGRTGIKGFYACGEAACNGIHGANRLASNSLLEGLVFGKKISEEVQNIISSSGPYRKPEVNKYGKQITASVLWTEQDSKDMMRQIQNIMTDKVGILRDRTSLEEALSQIKEFNNKIKDMKVESVSDMELNNMILLSQLIIEAALEREESRGAHYRSDFRITDNDNWRRNIIKKKS